MEPSILIVGAGTFGTSTAYHLSLSYKDPSRVRIIDQAPSPPEPAAAIDINRIIRTDYPSRLYCNLAFEAIRAWFWSLELQRFFHRAGWLMLDENGSDLSSRILKVFKDRGSTQTEEVLLDKLAERWDILKDTDIDGFENAYWNPEAGWCDAANATANFMAAAEKRGVERLTAQATELIYESDSGRITGARTTDGQHLTADKIMLATGAWTSSLLSPLEDTLNTPSQDRIEHQVQATGRISTYYTLSDAEAAHLTRAKMPVVVYGSQGEILPPSPDNLLKYNNSAISLTNTITTNSGTKISAPPSNRSQFLVPETLKAETEALLTSKVLPQLSQGKQAAYWRLCWDAQTPTDDWLMCAHPNPRLGNLYLAVGGSFHSYKFLPNAGQYMVNVLNGKSNGAEKDKAWAWKGGAEWSDAREKMVRSKRELRDVEGEGESAPAVGQAKL